MKLCKLVKKQVEYLLSELNLTEDEEKVFLLLTKGKSRYEIADKTNLSIACVDRRIRDIKEKLNKVRK